MDANEEKKVEELARELSTSVQQNEPGTLKYQWFRAGTAEEPKVIVWETYVFFIQDETRNLNIFGNANR